MPDEDRQDFASNNPYRHHVSGQEQAGRTSGAGGPITAEEAYRRMSEEAHQFRERTGQQVNPYPAWTSQSPPTESVSTLPLYSTQAATWQQPSAADWAAADEAAAAAWLQESNRQHGEGTPAEASSDQWDYATLHPDAAAHAVGWQPEWSQAPVNPVAGPANDSLSQLTTDATRTASSENTNRQGLRRQAAVRDPHRGRREQRRGTRGSR
jgi:hypothetical protein